MRQERRRCTERDHGRCRGAGFEPPDRRREQRAHRTLGDAVLGGDDQRVSTGVGEHPRVGGNRADVPHRRVHVAGVEQLGRLLRRFHHLADGEDADVVAGADASRALRPCPTWSAGTWRAVVFGHRSATGPDVIRIASSSITATSSNDDGANRVRPGTLVRSARSNSPWWLAPSSPVIPARSMQNTTGSEWRPTS